MSTNRKLSNSLPRRVFRVIAVVSAVYWLAMLWVLAGCTAHVQVAGACRAHEVGTVRFNEKDCPVAVCRPVDGGSAWVRLEDACR